MHHASAGRGSGWCPFDDLVLAVRRVRRAAGRQLTVLLIDLDAHQGNGVEMVGCTEKGNEGRDVRGGTGGQ